MSNMIFNLINKTFRWLHIRIYVRFVSFFFSQVYKKYNLKIILRNSVKDEKYFHFLYSDIDMALVTSDLNDFLKTNFRFWFKIFKFFYPFQGELECYTPAEWQFLTEEKSKLFEIYSKARQVRKYYWYGLYRPATLQNSKWIRQKNVIYQKVGVNVECEVEELFKKLLDSFQDLSFEGIILEEVCSYFHDFFQCKVVAPEDFENSGLKIDAHLMIALAAIFPMTALNAKVNNTLITKLYELNPRIKSLNSRLSAIERLEVLASNRIYKF